MNKIRFTVSIAAAVVAGALITSRVSATPKYEAVEVAESGTIVGVVSYDSAPREPRIVGSASEEDACHKDPIPDESLVVSAERKVRWAVASLRKIASGKAFPDEDPEAPVVLDQVGCRFVPHVVVVPAGRTLRVLNEDGVLHNVHAKSRKNKPINKSMPKQVKSMDFTFKRAEYIPVVCDVHDWMKSWVIVADHPYYAVTPEDGSFRLEQVPVGTHTLKIWHETLGTKTQEVKVEAGKETRIDVTLEQASK